MDTQTPQADLPSPIAQEFQTLIAAVSETNQKIEEINKESQSSLDELMYTFDTTAGEMDALDSEIDQLVNETVDKLDTLLIQYTEALEANT